MNLSEMRTFVRAQADTDATDATDPVLEVYARAAYRDIISRVQLWPTNRKLYSTSTVANTQQYALSALDPADIEYIVSVAYDGSPLEWCSMATLYELNDSSTGSGTPVMYSADSTSLYLWPPPADVKTVAVEGYRTFAAWPTGAAEPDLPRPFDEAICWYMLGKYYLAQEDLELSRTYMMEYEAAVNNQIERTLRTSDISAGPRLFGGPVLGPMSYEQWVRRNTEG